MFDQYVLIRKRGVITIPLEIRQKMKLEEGKRLHVSVNLNLEIVLREVKE